MERPKTEFSFTVDMKPAQFNAMTNEEKNLFYKDYLQQVHCILMGAIMASKESLDFVLKINVNLLDHIQIPASLDEIRKEKNMMIFITFVGNGEGRCFN